MTQRIFSGAAGLAHRVEHFRFSDVNCFGRRNFRFAKPVRVSAYPAPSVIVQVGPEFIGECRSSSRGSPGPTEMNSMDRSFDRAVKANSGPSRLSATIGD
jgi:hypothetical protein